MPSDNQQIRKNYENILRPQPTEELTEAISRKRRQYSPGSPLRHSHVLDGRELFVCVDSISGNSYYPSYVFKTIEAAQKFLDDVGQDQHIVVSIYDKIKVPMS
jgi:hypothetical protein